MRGVGDGMKFDTRNERADLCDRVTLNFRVAGTSDQKHRAALFANRSIAIDIVSRRIAPEHGEKGHLKAFVGSLVVQHGGALSTPLIRSNRRGDQIYGFTPRGDAGKQLSDDRPAKERQHAKIVNQRSDKRKPPDAAGVASCKVNRRGATEGIADQVDRRREVERIQEIQGVKPP